ncbi:ATP-binding protein [Alteromonas ponticola]|uniref:histidine kinase n=1 Tax=Alteromonas aquimaris TaxID=2998417 RepID=A0ABT3P9W6_9ALTE|nr:ATP-binding protein [Alteromonas aquimaris]MCW8109573.1 ATP-binding protein [Alteromonas aquimaris]
MANVLRTFHDIVTNQSLDFEGKARALLQYGLKLFALDMAIISWIHDGIYTVTVFESEGNEIEEGTEFPLGNTYCVHALDANKAIAFHHTGKSSIKSHPCYQNFKLEAYIGAPIYCNGLIYGTVNFSSTRPTSPFSKEQLDYIELFAQWVGSEISREVTVKQLNNNNQMLARLEQVAKIGTWELDMRTNELSWSDQTKVIHEVPQNHKPVLEKAISFYKEGESRDKIVNAVEHAIATGESYSVETQLVTAKNNVVWVKAIGSADIVENECRRLYGTIQDITDTVLQRRQIEEEREAAKRLLHQRSQLFAKISHELRTPLNGIIGMLNAALDNKNDSERMENLKVALRCSDVLLDIINEVLDYTKLNHGEMKLEPSAFSLSSLLADLVSLYHPVCDAKSITLTNESNIASDIWVYFDATRLRQVVSNILANAIKFTEQGGVTLKANAVSKGDATYLLKVIIRDTGIGMTDETLDSLFSPFSQGPKGIASKFGGTGLGLAIVKELLDLMDGKIEFSSEKGEGTTVIITLTLPRGNAQLVTDEDKSLPDFSQAKLKVLVVDDVEVNRMVMDSILQRVGVHADFAIDGKDAVFKCQRDKYDLIFMDCVMPEMDGMTASRTLINESIISPDCKIIALTANTSDLDKVECKEAGMHGFLAKPVSAHEVFKVMKLVAEPEYNI